MSGLCSYRESMQREAMNDGGLLCAHKDQDVSAICVCGLCAALVIGRLVLVRDCPW